MAWLEQHPTSGRFKVCFRWGGRKLKRTIKSKSPKDANAALVRFEENIGLLERGRLELPEGADIGVFLMSDGKIANKVEPQAKPRPVTFAELRERYVEVHSNGTLEKSSLETVKMHLRHFERSLGSGFVVATLSLSRLQDHVQRRSAKKGHFGKPLSPATIRKEISSLRAVWNWGAMMKLVHGPFPNRGLRFPKGCEKPPFQTWQEIERKMALGVGAVEKKELWDSLYLTLAEIEELLAHVKQVAGQPFVWPMFCFAAYTGARRSEMMRLRWTDVDFQTETVTLHEKKRSKDRVTSRRVPLSPRLLRVLLDWQAVHPGGQFVFCHELLVPHSKSKRTETAPITRNEAHHFFEHTLSGGKWRVLRGWHVFRHSFVSNCASRGLDQRMIDEWVGHQTDEMRKRYRHLHPNSQHEALRSVFCGQ